MRVQERLDILLEQGVIDEILRPLLSGKEADVYLVLSEGEERVAKVFKEADRRSFKHRADYTEGRKVRNSRSMRAMAKKSRFGREQTEAAWRNAEVDVIYKLQAAGVRVPTPYAFVDGVLVMELIRGRDGGPAPRLVDVTPERDTAETWFHFLIGEVAKMLCAGVVHGDLSDFNVLISHDGPVIIDFPQAIDPSHNNNAERLFVRDVKNLTRFLARFAPRLRGTRYAEEMWDLYRRNQLTPDTPLTGKYQPPSGPLHTNALLAEIAEIEREAKARRARLGLPERPARKPVQFDRPAPKPIGAKGGPKPKGAPGAAGADSPAKKKRRRRKKKKAPVVEAPSQPFDDLDAFLLVEDD